MLVFRCSKGGRGSERGKSVLQDGGNGWLKFTCMTAQLTPPVPCVNTTMPFLKGTGPNSKVLIAVPPATGNAANSAKLRKSGAR